MNAIGFRNGIIIPDYQTTVIMSTQKILSATVIAIFHLLESTIRDGEMSDKFVIRTDYRISILTTGNNHIPIFITTNAYIRISHKLCCPNWLSSIRVCGFIPLIHTTINKPEPLIIHFVKDRNTIFPTLRTLTGGIKRTKPFSIPAIYLHSINIISMYRTIC